MELPELPSIVASTLQVWLWSHGPLQLFLSALRKHQNGTWHTSAATTDFYQISFLFVPGAHKQAHLTKDTLLVPSPGPQWYLGVSGIGRFLTKVHLSALFSLLLSDCLFIGNAIIYTASRKFLHFLKTISSYCPLELWNEMHWISDTAPASC